MFDYVIEKMRLLREAGIEEEELQLQSLLQGIHWAYADRFNGTNEPASLRDFYSRIVFKQGFREHQPTHSFPAPGSLTEIVAKQWISEISQQIDGMQVPQLIWKLNLPVSVKQVLYSYSSAPQYHDYALQAELFNQAGGSKLESVAEIGDTLDVYNSPDLITCRFSF